jgi:hypothetical protein
MIYFLSSRPMVRPILVNTGPKMMIVKKQILACPILAVNQNVDFKVIRCCLAPGEKIAFILDRDDALVKNVLCDYKALLVKKGTKGVTFYLYLSR